MRDYRLYLRDILAAVLSIETFVAGMDFLLYWDTHVLNSYRGNRFGMCFGIAAPLCQRLKPRLVRLVGKLF